MGKEGCKASTTSHTHMHAADVEMRAIRENSAKRQQKKEEKDKRWCDKIFFATQVNVSIRLVKY